MQSLKEKYADYFKVGVSLNESTIISHKDIIKQHFNSATCDYAMKYGAICDIYGNYNFSNADKIYNFCSENNIAMRGHTLIWNYDIPADEFKLLSNKEAFERMEEHMKIMAKRYPSIYCWDVVNEAIIGNKCDLTRNSLWYDKFGSDYFDMFFSMASKTFGNIPLYYNEDEETHVKKVHKICETIKRSLDNGVRIDGLGLQCHINIYEPNVDDYKRALDEYSKLGINIQITEMDVSIYDYEKGRYQNPPANLIERQAQLYSDYFKMFRDYKEIIETVTLWAVADDATWLDNYPVKNRKDWPMLFDIDRNPKEAFYRILEF